MSSTSINEDDLCNNPTTMKVLLWMSTADGKIPVDMLQFLMSMETKHDVDMTFPIRLPIATARNKIINHAINNNFDYIWRLDDDNPPEMPNALDLLLEHGADIVSWCVPSRQRHKDWTYKLCIYDKKEVKDGVMRHQMEKMPTSFMEIANCGCWCVVMSVKCLKELVQHFPAPCETSLHKYHSIWDDRVNSDYIENAWDSLWIHNIISEDLILVERLTYLGYKAFADHRVYCKHQTTWYVTIRDL